VLVASPTGSRHLQATRPRHGDAVTAAPTRPRPRPADPALQQQRRLRLAAALTAARLRLAVVPEYAVRRRQRVQVCSAARILTAVGARVDVRQPSSPWPRTPGRLVVTDAAGGRLADLALLTAVPRTTLGWSAVADRVLGGRTSSPKTLAGSVLCPVTVRFRDDDGPLDDAPRTLPEVLAVRGLVVEVQLLPALAPPGSVLAA
jgi:hypothetical protein